MASNLRTQEKQKLMINPQCNDIMISSHPRCTLSDLIRFIQKYHNNQHLYSVARMFAVWYNFKISHLISLYIQLYLRDQIAKQFKYDIHIDRYYAQIPTVSDIQQHYRPYLDHIVSVINIYNCGTNNEEIIKNLHIYMNKPIIHGPILTLSMNKKDLLVFGYIHRFQKHYNFYSQMIPWDVVKLIHAFFDKINKEYLENFENIKQKIIHIESQIQQLRLNGNSDDIHIMDEIHEKQSELLTLYNMTKDIRFQEEYEPHLIDKYVINTKQYQLTALEYAEKIRKMEFELFETAYNEHSVTQHFFRHIVQMKPFLLDLLNVIVPIHCQMILNTHKQVIEEQIDIYADYCQLKIGYSWIYKAQLYGELPQWILEIFHKENAWTKQITKRVETLTLQKQTYKSNTSKYNRGITNKSFTVD